MKANEGTNSWQDCEEAGTWTEGKSRASCASLVRSVSLVLTAKHASRRSHEITRKQYEIRREQYEGEDGTGIEMSDKVSRVLSETNLASTKSLICICSALELILERFTLEERITQFTQGTIESFMGMNLESKIESKMECSRSVCLLRLLFFNWSHRICRAEVPFLLRPETSSLNACCPDQTLLVSIVF